MDYNLRGAVTAGRFRVIWPDGSETVYGDGTGREAGVRITTAATLRRLATDPALAIGEAYMDGTLIPVGCTHHDLLVLLMHSIAGKRVPIIEVHDFLGRLGRRIAQANNASRSKANVAHHYDLSGELYSLFLDKDRQYSCAYFADDNVSLEEAQIAKKRHIAAKLLLDRPGLEVLDIGCGWGGMAITLAREFGARVTGITLSEEQLAAARARAAAAGLSDRVTFELIDYRQMNRTFDRIVSVGMFEHVGVPNFRSFFETVKRCLKDDGVALIHSIGRMAGPGATNPWMAKYIFPGGYSPALSEVMGPVERAGLITSDVEILRLHYAKTLAHWRQRFAANRDKIAALYDERFCRMFEFYLSASQLTFEAADHMNFQIQLVKNRHALPLTRDYMFEQEREFSYAAAAE
jgi:cyclopropane-fatty-acyl-phospholipid synthase